MSVLVDNVETVRARNNGLWMDILRIALQKSPRETKGILKEINANDQIISEILREVASAD